MGRMEEYVKVIVSISNHNSEQDDIDQALFEDLRGRIEQMLKEEKYAPIRPWIY